MDNDIDNDPIPVHWNLDEQKKINDAIDEAVASLVREDGEKQLRKDIIEELKDSLGITPSLFNALVKERFDGKSKKNVEKHEEIVAINEMLYNNNKKTLKVV